MRVSSVADYIDSLEGDFQSILHEVETIAFVALSLLSDEQEQELVERLVEDYGLEIETEEGDKELYTFFNASNIKCMVMQGAKNGKFIARWNVDRENYTEEFSTLEKAMKWLTNEGLIAEEVEEEE